jgi:hypothetical protein
VKKSKKRRSSGRKQQKTMRKPKRESTASPQSQRAEGIRLFKLAGRPTKEQFILIYGERGPRMTWDERAKAGVPASKFQSALAAKQSRR